MKLKCFTVVILFCLFFLISCEQVGDQGELKNVGLLVSDTINDHSWGTKGYKGILQIQSNYNVDVYYKEGMNSQAVIERAVEEFVQKDVNLIFGHGHSYADYFSAISLKYPDVHFVIFNGEAKNSNVTSLNFDSYAMGFFAGMVSGHMTKSNRIGMIPAFQWQPEVQGFYDGAKYENKRVDIDIQYVNSFDNVEQAQKIAEAMIADNRDIIYPAGDNYSVPLIEKIKEHGLYAIGYSSDQSDLGNKAVLTSTVQHIDKLYEWAAEEFNKGELKSGNFSFDFKDDVISLGKFSPLVPEDFAAEVRSAIQYYEDTGKLPNER